MFWKVILSNLLKGPKLLPQFRSYTKCLTISEISEISNMTDLPSDVVCVKGWIRAVRSHKDVVFLDVNDGSQLFPLQAVIPSSEYKSEASFGSSVEIHGMLEKRSLNKVELKVSKLNVIGCCDNKEYPIKMGQKHSLDYLRSHPQLKFRTNYFLSLMKIKNAATMSIHKSFQEKKFCHIDTPILTSNDCEGAGELFHVEPRQKLNSSGAPTYLTVSGQLHLEAAAAYQPRVYCFGPTFRAEPSHTRHHLSEFNMAEAELSFVDRIEELTIFIESIIKRVVNDILSECKDEVDHFLKNVAKPGHVAILENIVSKNFHCITYTEAINMLIKSDKVFQNKVFWGIDLHKEHEQHLVDIFHSTPVFVTDYPTNIKPFYSKANEDGKTVASVDLLFPGVGEVCGGGLREHSVEKLKHFTSQSLDWYLDLRRFGSHPHGGFGIGFERLIQAVLGVENIKDTVPFPRSTGSCRL